MLSNRPLGPAAARPAVAKPPAVAAAPVAAVGPLALPLPAPPGSIGVAAIVLDRPDTFRKVALYFGLAMLLVRIGVLSEIMMMLTGTNTYLLYLVTPLALLGALFTGGVRRTLQSRAAILWLAFFAWMALAVPFSAWRGGSAAEVVAYARTNLIGLFVIGGLTTSWKEVRHAFYTMAVAGFVVLMVSRAFAVSDESGRFSLGVTGSVIGNSNDLASQLILVLPFVAFLAVDRNRSVGIRLIAIAATGYGIYSILATASRGGLVALAGVALFLLWQASALRRMLILLAILLTTVVAIPLLPPATLARLGSVFGGEHSEAEASQASRVYLFKKSVEFTIRHPLFGVGPYQFALVEGMESRSKGEIGNWHVTHCAYTQVSAECGIPAALFFLASIGVAVRSVFRTYKRARSCGHTDLANGCMCYLVAMTGYLISLAFLANAVGFQLIAMVGLAIAVSYAGEKELDRLQGQAVTGQRLAVS